MNFINQWRTLPPERKRQARPETITAVQHAEGIRAALQDRARERHERKRKLARQGYTVRGYDENGERIEKPQPVERLAPVKRSWWERMKARWFIG